MNKNNLFLIVSFSVLLFYACSSESRFVEENFNLAEVQYREMMHELTPGMMPRTVKNDKLWSVPVEDWTSGFWPGALWYMYEYTQDAAWKEQARIWTDYLEPIQYFTGHHDVGFMMYCSYGNGYRLTKNEKYIPVLIQSAKSLCERYSPKVGCIQSWDARKSIGLKNDWEYPVIIDNMMNLELLYFAYEQTGDAYFKEVALNHALNTMKNQVREDFSCYHVVNYDPQTGKALHKQTAQGFADNSTWARGQAWGIYGFTMMYRFTKDNRFLETATGMADFYLDNKNMPDDLIPYWDFNAGQAGYNPDFNYNKNDFKVIPRDASAAAITSSAFFELSTYMEKKEIKQKYYNAAIKTLRNLSSDAYRTKTKENHYFLLKHSVGNLPGNNEINTPLIYADYYFLEALLRYRNSLKQEKYKTTYKLNH